MLRNELPKFKWGGGIKQSFHSLDFIPSEVKQRMTRTTWESFLILLPAITHVLEADNIPTPKAVLTKAGPSARYFIEIGGKVEHALDLVINVAREQSTFGDEFFDEMMEELNEEGSEGAVRYHGMAKCVNDLEFDLVRQRLDVPRLPSSYSDDDMEDDDEDVDDGDADI